MCAILATTFRGIAAKDAGADIRDLPMCADLSPRSLGS
jgi:hypothetical protein